MKKQNGKEKNQLFSTQPICKNRFLGQTLMLVYLKILWLLKIFILLLLHFLIFFKKFDCILFHSDTSFQRGLIFKNRMIHSWDIQQNVGSANTLWTADLKEPLSVRIRQKKE